MKLNRATRLPEAEVVYESPESDTPNLDLIMTVSLSDLLEDVIRSSEQKVVCTICGDPNCTFINHYDSYRGMN
jgi:hypothetical protein